MSLKTLLLACIDWVLQLLIPTRPALCFYSYPDYSDNARHLHADFMAMGLDHNVVWLVSGDKDIADLRQSIIKGKGRLAVVNKNSLLGYWHYLRSRYIFHTHGVYGFNRFKPLSRKKRVNLWHGMPIKHIGNIGLTAKQNYTQHDDWCIATSDYFQPIMAAAFDLHPSQSLICQLPRNHLLTATNTKLSGNTDSALKLQGKPYILWMPSYRQSRSKANNTTVSNSHSASFLDELDPVITKLLIEQCAQNEWLLVIKLHPLDALNHADKPSLGDSVRWWDNNTPMGDPLYSVIAQARGLITDISSVLIDYFVSGKPLAVLGFNSTAYTREIVTPLNLVMGPGLATALTTTDDVSRFLEQAKAPAKEFHGNTVMAANLPAAATVLSEKLQLQ